MGEFDVVVVGGGPGGAATAAFLAREGWRVALLDKARFPRDKTCGDAISGKAVSVLRELGLDDWVEREPHAKAMGVVFSSPAGDVVQIPFPRRVDPRAMKDQRRYTYAIPGYTQRRLVYDNILFQFAKKQDGVTALEEHEATDVIVDDGRAAGVVAKGPDGAPRRFRARFVVGADGALSVVSRKLGAYDRDPAHWIGAFRIYYEGITGMTDDIEIHFIEDLIPGYFWIFPLENGLANVGAGMLETDLKGLSGAYHGKKVNMREITYRVIREHPLFKERFAKAREVPDSFHGWLLPLGSKHVKVHGNGWMLVGDAAALIDPFSGEGIGNAMVSGRLASDVITKALRAGDVSERVTVEYERRLREMLDHELQTSYKLQKLGRRRWLLNWVIRRAARKPEVREIISAMLADRERKDEFGNLLFYLKLLLR